MASVASLDIQVRVDGYAFERIMACVASALDPTLNRRDRLTDLFAIGAMTEITTMADIARAEHRIDIGEVITFALRVESESLAR